jgi:hypothetical protein
MTLFPGGKSALLSIAIYLLSGSAFAGEGSWTSSGPTAEVAAIAIVAEPFTVVAAGRPVGASQDAVFTKSASDPAWTERAEASAGVTITALAVDASHPTTVYAAGRVDVGPPAGAIYVSRDAGVTWSFLHLFENSPVLTIAVDPVVSTTLYVGGSVCSTSSLGLRCMAFVSRSADGGSKWSSSPLFSWAASVTALAIREPNRLYAATDYGLLYSGDSGATWIGQFGSPDKSQQRVEITAIAINPLDPEIIYIGWHIPPCGFFTKDCGGPFGEGGLAVTGNGGDSWTDLNEPGQVPSLTIHPTDPEILYAVRYTGSNLENRGIYRSRDTGMTWSKLGDLSGAAAIQFNPLTGVIYAATAAGVFEYEDTPLAGPSLVPNDRKPRQVPSRQ